MKSKFSEAKLHITVKENSWKIWCSRSRQIEKVKGNRRGCVHRCLETRKIFMI